MIPADYIYQSVRYFIKCHIIEYCFLENENGNSGKTIGFDNLSNIPVLSIVLWKMKITMVQKPLNKKSVILTRY